MFFRVWVSTSIAGITRSSRARTAAMCRAVGKVSLEDWDIFTSSLGWSRFSPARALARPAMTSFRFILVWVPEPVCHTTRGKLSSSFPERISSQTFQMARRLGPVILAGRSIRFAMAAPFFRMAKAWIISQGMGS